MVLTTVVRILVYFVKFRLQDDCLPSPVIIVFSLLVAMSGALKLNIHYSNNAKNNTKNNL